MNDAEVQKQITQMINFIKQEAKEKATEIELKAEQDFMMERSNIVQLERVRIVKEYEQKHEQIEVQKRIQRSHIQKESKLQVLRARDDLLVRIYDAAVKELPQLSTRNPQGYRQFLKDILLQAVNILNEKTLVITCRAADMALVQQLVPEVLNAHQGGCQVIVVDTNNPLPIAGGLKVWTENRRIHVDNTLESRLKLAYEQNLPQLRMHFFGKSKTRKFDN